MKTTKSIVPVFLLALSVSSCGGGGSSGSSNNDTVVEGQSPPIPFNEEVTPVPALENFEFIIDSQFRAETSTAFVELIEEEIGKSVTALNAIPNLFNNMRLPVIYGNCGQANAFYSPSERSITLCDELSGDAFNYFLTINDSDDDDALGVALVEALGMMNFVLFHEVGHALDDIRDLGVGGNFESVADAIGTVLSVRTGQSLGPVFAALYFAQNTEGSFADVHNSGADRAGDLLCWTLGSSSRLTELFSGVASNLVQSGRDCVSEYADQLDFVSRLVPGLLDIPPVTSLRKESAGHSDRYKRIDEMLIDLLVLDQESPR